MAEWDAVYPQYGLARHKGYALRTTLEPSRACHRLANRPSARQCAIPGVGPLAQPNRNSLSRIRGLIPGGAKQHKVVGPSPPLSPTTFLKGK